MKPKIHFVNIDFRTNGPNQLMAWRCTSGMSYMELSDIHMYIVTGPNISIRNLINKENERFFERKLGLICGLSQFMLKSLTKRHEQDK